MSIEEEIAHAIDVRWLGVRVSPTPFDEMIARRLQAEVERGHTSLTSASSVGLEAALQRRAAQVTVQPTPFDQLLAPVTKVGDAWVTVSPVPSCP